MIEFFAFLVVALFVFGYIQDKKSTVTAKSRTTTQNYYTQNNVYIQNNYVGKPEAHTSRVWERLDYKVNYGESYAYKYYGNEIYTEDQVSRISSSHDAYLSSNQKKVKSLGGALVGKTGSKQKAKQILVDRYDFDEDTAKYAVGYHGTKSW
jgi:hypothetical protein